MDGSRWPLGLPRWAIRMVLAPFSMEQFEGGNGLLDAVSSFIIHLSPFIFHRDVIIDAHEDTFAPDV